MATIKIDPPVKISINASSTPLEFTTLYQIETWIEKEHSFWLDLQQKTERSPNLLKPKLGQIITNANQIKQFVENNKKDDNTQKRKALNDEQINSLNGQLRKFAGHNPTPHNSPTAKRALKYAEDNPDLALAYLGLKGVHLFQTNEILNNIHGNQDRLAAFEAWTKAQALQATEEYSHYKASADERTLLNDARAEWERLTHEFSEEVEQAKSSREHYNQELKNTNDRYQSLARKFFTKTRSEIEEFKNRYRSELALQIPVKYWTDKKGSHQRWAVTWGLSFLVSIALGVFGIISQFDEISSVLSGDVANVSFGAFALIAAPFFLYVWFLRILSRLLLSNLHLMRDAEERAVMTQTFLALAEAGNYITENDRILILHSLFRAASSENNDDGAPPHWFDLLTNRLRGPQ